MAGTAAANIRLQAALEIEAALHDTDISHCIPISFKELGHTCQASEKKDIKERYSILRQPQTVESITAHKSSGKHNQRTTKREKLTTENSPEQAPHNGYTCRQLP